MANHSSPPRQTNPNPVTPIHFSPQKVGLDSVLRTKGAMDALSMSLHYRFKDMAVMVIDMLSICCWAAPEGPASVVEAMDK